VGYNQRPKATLTGLASSGSSGSNGYYQWCFEVAKKKERSMKTPAILLFAVTAFVLVERIGRRRTDMAFCVFRLRGSRAAVLRRGHILQPPAAPGAPRAGGASTAATSHAI
jgi:hypothetical protein